MQAWCHERELEDGRLVTEKKLGLFQEEKVLTRRTYDANADPSDDESLSGSSEDEIPARAASSRRPAVEKRKKQRGTKPLRAGTVDSYIAAVLDGRSR